MLKRPEMRWPAVGLVATSVGFVLTIVPYYMWWGGWSVPARFLLPVLPLAAPMIAVAFEQCRGAASRGVSGLLVLASVGSFAVVMYQPQRRLLFNERDGSGGLVEAIQGGMDLTVLLPSFVQPDWVGQLPYVGGWLVTAAIAGAVAYAANHRQVTASRAFWSAVIGLVGFITAGSLVSGKGLTPSNGGDVVPKGQQSVIAAFDGERLLAYSYGDRRVLGETELFARATISQPAASRRPEPDPGQPQIQRGRVFGPYALPAGRYRVRVSVDPTMLPIGGGSSDGDADADLYDDPYDDVWIAYHRGPNVLSRTSVGASGVADMTLDLPVTFDPLWIGASSEALARAITHVRIEPESVEPRTGRPSIANIRQSEILADTPGRYAIHVDDNVYPELTNGFWVRGGRSASVHVSPNGASMLRVTIQNGAVPGPVTVEVDGTLEVLELRRGETREYRVPLTGNEVTVPLRFEPINGFRPSERNPESADTRWLGCRVVLELE